MKSIFKLTTLILITPSLFTFIFPHSAKGNNNQFDVCLKDLITAGVTAEQAQTGCADALVPRELSTCVLTIATGTDIKAIDALKSCYQVRRPVDMGNCVVSINKNSILGSATKATMTKTQMETTETESFAMGNEDNTLTSKVSPVMMALNTCRASLLPARHSECVIALSRTPQVFDPNKAMTTCLSAEDFPEDLFPSYQ